MKIEFVTIAGLLHEQLESALCPATELRALPTKSTHNTPERTLLSGKPRRHDTVPFFESVWWMTKNGKRSFTACHEAHSRYAPIMRYKRSGEIQQKSPCAYCIMLQNIPQHMETETKLKPPYVAYATFKNLIGSMKDLVPARIDPTHPFMVGQSGSNQSFLMSALRFFGLVADRTPTPLLKQLAQSDGDERKAVWKEVFEKAYHPILDGIDLTTATAGMLHERFRAQDLNGETVNKCFSFFVAGAEDAGLPLANHLKPGSRTNSGNRKPRRPKPAPQAPKAVEAEHDSELHHPSTMAKTPAATLLLDKEGTRKVTLHAPPTITQAELDRIQKWLSFQLIVEDA